ncbi:hypothetical protein CEUSTIGMA_g9094.t1 [Chlamydomonas eustigma]|uniref:Guanylate cyclase domain-containing protein n=1 Tax=Chlamydomonas eustigma TaxID=1157962 RepID=A0A250XF57_9CHLO|nr:hypothetical protein CEUSTIGMA_g9094.t1 [Chlamydomonas eustigma]|eukprot:GAX81666.1 hypothetical protein CEUSTIGMA_g9094.t1 [Chlamydomonas eustigma]
MAFLLSCFRPKGDHEPTQRYGHDESKALLKPIAKTRRPEAPPNLSPSATERYGAMLVDAPCLITAVALDDNSILFQNKLSDLYHEGPGYLDVLFSCQDTAMREDMIRAVRSGGTWKQVMQVPIKVDTLIKASKSHIHNSASAEDQEEQQQAGPHNLHSNLFCKTPQGNANANPGLCDKDFHEPLQPLHPPTTTLLDGGSASSHLNTNSAKGSQWSSSPCGSTRKIGSDRSATQETLNSRNGIRVVRPSTPLQVLQDVKVYAAESKSHNSSSPPASRTISMLNSLRTAVRAESPRVTTAFSVGLEGSDTDACSAMRASKSLEEAGKLVPTMQHSLPSLNALPACTPEICQSATEMAVRISERSILHRCSAIMQRPQNGGAAMPTGSASWRRKSISCEQGHSIPPRLKYCNSSSLDSPRSLTPKGLADSQKLKHPIMGTDVQGEVSNRCGSVPNLEALSSASRSEAGPSQRMSRFLFQALLQDPVMDPYNAVQGDPCCQLGLDMEGLAHSSEVNSVVRSGETVVDGVDGSSAQLERRGSFACSNQRCGFDKYGPQYMSVGMNLSPQMFESVVEEGASTQMEAGAAAAAAAADHDDPDAVDQEEGAEGDSQVCDEEGCAWHEVTAKPFLDPVTGRQAIMIMQNDVTNRVNAESILTGLSEGQLSMLSGIFPRHVIEFLSFNGSNAAPELMGQLARTHNDVTILFMDIVGFTDMSKQVEPSQVMTFLNQLFSMFDQMVDPLGVQKVETAGDCYVAAAGILSYEGGFSVVGQNHDPAESARKVMNFAKAMLEAAKKVVMPHNGQPVNVRVGLHTGPCVTGLVGSKLPKFSIFGDTMNTASRMESTSKPGRIQVSEASWRLLKDSENWTPTGGIEVKGKGLMNTYLWTDTQSTEASDGSMLPRQGGASDGSMLPRQGGASDGSMLPRQGGASSPYLTVPPAHLEEIVAETLPTVTDHLDSGVSSLPQSIPLDCFGVVGGSEGGQEPAQHSTHASSSDHSRTRDGTADVVHLSALYKCLPETLVCHGRQSNTHRSPAVGDAGQRLKGPLSYIGQSSRKSPSEFRRTVSSALLQHAQSQLVEEGPEGGRPPNINCYEHDGASTYQALSQEISSSSKNTKHTVRHQDGVISTPVSATRRKKSSTIVLPAGGHSPCLKGSLVAEDDMQALLTSMVSVDVLNQMRTMEAEGMGLQLMCKHTLAWQKSKGVMRQSKSGMPRNASCPKLVSLQC